jgi:hypothetical protein
MLLVRQSYGAKLPRRTPHRKKSDASQLTVNVTMSDWRSRDSHYLKACPCDRAAQAISSFTKCGKKWPASVR